MINLSRLQLILQTAIKAYRYPTEANHLSHLGELSGYYCIKDIHNKMLNHPTGQRILRDKPRVPEIIEQTKLLNLNANSFGYHYGQFMASHNLKSSERPIVRYIQDPELAFVYQRYKDIHDFIHVLLMFDISIYDEIVVKWFEMVQLGLPSTTLSAFVGSFKLTCEEKNNLIQNLPTIISKAQRSEFMMNVYFEEHLQDDLNLFRKSLKLI
ncbi:hypothetical protein pb186bvf_001889 [Paramecium bursaria]